ncbi:MAG: hypothetical protein GY702_23180, partial [Desulfobulbaceae bacterium]|nr:hypothetical protein [Desulfobulbaceae bacterium]
ISLYGDSFTFGSEVDNDACWSSALSEIMGCCVKNFGVPGYGSDQAYLRFTKQKMDIAQITILGFMSENIIRNLTRNWDLISTVGYYGLKPRFSINKEKSLTLVPLPELSEKQYLQSIGLKSPQLQLPHENFQPGGAAGEVQLAFPYTLSVIRNLQSSRMLCSRRQEPYHLQFYEEDHSLRGLDVTVKIFEKSLKRVRKEEAGHSSCCWSIYMNCIPTEKPAYGHMVT